ncbi:HNH endonuclease [Streptomyces sp. NPDC005776]|uniref:HNH endonuclease n=1 Tax=Streptomyces sp. NPDC005776 TaxID=3154676 RepID=UPI0033C8806B
MCGHGQVKQLDHVLPKAHFPALCVDLLNLIPTCSDCNKAKGDKKPSSAETTFLHPYIDDIDKDPWLVAHVLPGPPPTLEFAIDPPPSWDAITTARAQYTFDRLEVAAAYAARANETLHDIRYQLHQLFEAGGEDLVREHLQDEAASRRANHLNGWEGVTYRTLAACSGYCAGGFRMTG